MDILVLSATPFEFYAFRQAAEAARDHLTERDTRLHFLVGGVGMVPTVFNIMRFLEHQPVDVAIQMGIAGSFRKHITPGDLVQVSSEAFGDMGAEDGEGQLDLFQMNLWEGQEFPFDNKLLFAPESVPLSLGQELKKVHAITVNMVSGTASTIACRRKKFAADVESMEGAAFHYVCLQKHIPFRQIRAISNYVEPRDTSGWKMKEAIEVLNAYMIRQLL